MLQIKSGRAEKILKNPKYIQNEPGHHMKKCPFPGPNLWADLEWEGSRVKKLSFFGQLTPIQIIFLESMATLLEGKAITYLDELTIRECEAFLRDKNSEPAVEGMTDSDESELKKIFRWVRNWPSYVDPASYSFSYDKGPFFTLKLAEKVREVKAFLNSPEILTIYQNFPRPELIDLDGMTVYLNVSYETKEDKDLFEQLHILGVTTFRDENLNFIPET